MMCAANAPWAIPAVAIPAMRSALGNCSLMALASSSATKVLTSGNDNTMRLSQ